MLIPVVFFFLFLNIHSDVGHIIKSSGSIPSPVLHMTLDETEYESLEYSFQIHNKA